MSRKRKNAGEGYGYMFSGAFAKKSDAKKKEKQRKGSFVKPVMLKSGMRYAVMTPRLNPVKRKKKVMVTPASNPSELLVMGANPHDITVPPGSTITIRMNPVPRENWMSSARAGIERGQQHQSEERFSEHMRSRKRVRFAEETSEARKRTERPRFKWQRGSKRATNPSAAALREDFTGMPAEYVSVSSEPHMPAGDYAQLGELLSLYFKPRHGGQVQEIKFNKNSRPLVLADESGKQIWFAGGDQNVSPSLDVFGRQSGRGGLFELGEARRIDYKQRKEHVTHPNLDEWRHEFGEESGVQPVLMFDTRTKRLLLQGGEYEIRPEGIVN